MLSRILSMLRKKIQDELATIKDRIFLIDSSRSGSFIKISDILLVSLSADISQLIRNEKNSRNLIINPRSLITERDHEHITPQHNELPSDINTTISADVIDQTDSGIHTDADQSNTYQSEPNESTVEPHDNNAVVGYPAIDIQSTSDCQSTAAINPSSSPASVFELPKIISPTLSDKITNRIREMRLIDCGHYIVNSSYCARDWITTRKLLEDSNVCNQLINAITDHMRIYFGMLNKNDNHRARY